MKKIISVFISFVFIDNTLSASMQVFAQTNDNIGSSSTQEIVLYSEYSAYLESSKKTDDELLANGYTYEEIEELRSFSFENALLERASHSDSELMAMGYTDEQIRLLKEYDASPLTENSPVLAATAVCTGKIVFHSYYEPNDQLFFLYHFSWSSMPLSGYVDTVAVSWQAIDSNALYISSSATYKRGTIYMSSTSTGEDYSSQILSLTAMLGFNGYMAEYETVQVVPEDNGTLAVWAKEGYLWFAITPDGDNTISTLKVYGAVGHKITIISVSVGFDASNGSYSFSFTPSSAYDTVGAANYTLKPDGTCYPNQGINF